MAKRRPSKAASAATINVLGQPSCRIASDNVEAFVSQLGGQLAPITFDRSGRKIQPLSVAPWHDERQPRSMPALLRVLRGDFFCMPFGGNERRYRDEQHPPHGETANARWSFVSRSRSGGETSLRLRLRTKVRPGQVEKRLRLVDGHDVIYQRHTVSGMTGPMNFGHHAMLKFPDEPGSGVVSTSRFVYGQVYPGVFERPENGGYSFLKPAAEFDSLQRVPTVTGETADLSRYPARRGYEDVVMLVADDTAPFAWSAVTFPKQRYVWFALRDPRVLRETILWISNRGRHYPPWNGRHVNVMGIEDVTSYFHDGLAESAASNPLSQRGIATHVTLDPSRPLVVNYLFGVALIPLGFDRVESIDPTPGGVALISSSGKRAKAAVDMTWNASA